RCSISSDTLTRGGWRSVSWLCPTSIPPHRGKHAPFGVVACCPTTTLAPQLVVGVPGEPQLAGVASGRPSLRPGPPKPAGPGRPQAEGGQNNGKDEADNDPQITQQEKYHDDRVLPACRGNTCARASQKNPATSTRCNRRPRSPSGPGPSRSASLSGNQGYDQVPVGVVPWVSRPGALGRALWLWFFSSPLAPSPHAP